MNDMKNRNARQGRIRRLLSGSAMAVVLVLGGPLAATAAINDCAIDYDLDTVRTANDFALFMGLWAAGSSDADLNGDQVVDIFDANTFIAYYGFPVCPWKGDYQYNRVIDPVDSVFFQTLYAAGSLRADLDNDTLITPADAAAFIGGFGTVY